VDRYLFSFAYSDAEMAAAGVKRSEVVGPLLDESCLTRGARLLGESEWLEALRHLAFGFAVYPRAAVRRLRFWALLGLLTLGPFGPWVARRLLAARERSRRTA
jgi:hypothetical protein